MNHTPNEHVFSYPEDKLKCEHICDTYVYECIIGCNHGTECMRNCWIEHDKCANNCPCNEECPEGCPEPYVGHPCDTWFCQGYILACAAENESNREPCNHGDQNTCERNGCCWTSYHIPDSDVPWCHQPKKQHINP